MKTTKHSRFLSILGLSIVCYLPLQAQVVIPQEVRATLHELQTDYVIQANRYLVTDVNGDGLDDYAGLITHKQTDLVSLLIILQTDEPSPAIFGGAENRHPKEGFGWVETIKAIPAGETIAPVLVDTETGDIMGEDESHAFKLIGTGIRLGQQETGGGKILYWTGKGYSMMPVE